MVEIWAENHKSVIRDQPRTNICTLIPQQGPKYAYPCRRALGKQFHHSDRYNYDLSSSCLLQKGALKLELIAQQELILLRLRRASTIEGCRKSRRKELLPDEQILLLFCLYRCPEAQRL